MVGVTRLVAATREDCRLLNEAASRSIGVFFIDTKTEINDTTSLEAFFLVCLNRQGWINSFSSLFTQSYVLRIKKTRLLQAFRKSLTLIASAVT